MYNPIHSDPTRTNAERSTVVAPTPPTQEQDVEEVAQVEEMPTPVTLEAKAEMRLIEIDSRLGQIGSIAEELTQLGSQKEYILRCNRIRQAGGDTLKRVNELRQYLDALTDEDVTTEG